MQILGMTCLLQLGPTRTHVLKLHLRLIPVGAELRLSPAS